MEVNKLKRIFAGLISVTMLLSVFVGCDSSTGDSNDSGDSSSSDSTDDSSSEDATGDDGIVQLDMYYSPGYAGTAGLLDNSIGKEITAQTGVQLNIVTADEDKFKLMLAGNDLPDIIYSNMTEQGMVDYVTLISGGHVMALDDLIAENAPNLQQQQSKLEFSKQFKSNGDNVIYFIPNNYNFIDYEAGETPYPDNTGGIRFYSSWDAFQKIGCPEITTKEEFLDALVAMQEAVPETKDGLKTYALSAWTDWGLWPYFIPTTYGDGYFYTTANVYYNRATNEFNYLYLLDSFWEGLEFYNQAYRRGILDPEAFTMKFDNYSEKVQSGQILTIYSDWWADSFNDQFAAKGDTELGFVPMLSGYEYECQFYNGDYPVGDGIDHSDALSTNCSDPVAAIKVLDYLHSEAGALLNYRGVEGVHWELVDGVPQWTETFLESQKVDTAFKTNEGIGTLWNYIGFNSYHVAEDGYPVNFESAEEFIPSTLTPAEADFSEAYNVDYPGQLVQQWIDDGKISAIQKSIIWPHLTTAETDETKSITADCEEWMTVQAITCIMSGSDEEFEKNKQIAIDGMMDRGIETAMVEYNEIYSTAQESAATFDPYSYAK